jgi:thiamine-phosphate pyrophosphorylase
MAPTLPTVPTRRTVPTLPALVVVTDRRQAEAAGHSLADVVAGAADGGARWVLLREKELSPPARGLLAEDLLAILAPVDGRLVVAGDPGLAAEVGAAAVHLAAFDPWPPPRPGGPVVGRSCHGADELSAAHGHGAAYATLSPVFATSSKPGYGPPLGLDGLAAACAAVPDLPVLALGGVRSGRAAGCLAAGARGVAVMGEVMRAPDPAAVVRDLVGELAARVGEAGSA